MDQQSMTISDRLSWILKNRLQSPLNEFKVLQLYFTLDFNINTPESFQYALDLWRELHKKGFEPNRKAFCLIAALALNQGKPEFALELISSCPQFRHIDCRCIKVQAFAALNRLDDVTQFFKKTIRSEKFDRENSIPVAFFKDTIAYLEEALNKANKEEHEELVRFLEEMKAQNLVQDKTLEESLTRPIERRRLNERQDNNNLNMNRNRTPFRRFERQNTGMGY